MVQTETQKQNNNNTSLFTITLIFLLIAGSPAVAQMDPSSVRLPAMTPALNLGKLSYDAKCASCHGVNTAGTDKGPTFLHRVYHPGHHGDGAFYMAPKKGTRAHHWKFGDMPPVDEISDAQIKNIISYVRALQNANGVF
mgnify:CR=1 FL=1